MAGAEIGAAEASRGHQHHAADAGRSGGAARFGDTLDRERGLFGGARQRLQFLHRRQRAVDQVEVGPVLRELLRRGEPGELVLRRGFSHGDSARGQRIGVAGEIVGGNHRLALADQYAQAEIVALRAFRFFHRAVAQFYGQ